MTFPSRAECGRAKRKAVAREWKIRFAIVVSSLSASAQFQEDLEAEILEVFKRFEVEV